MSLSDILEVGKRSLKVNLFVFGRELYPDAALFLCRSAALISSSSRIRLFFSCRTTCAFMIE